MSAHHRTRKGATGGPAFPRPGFVTEEGNNAYDNQPEDGMSLRDWWAGMALVGLLAGGADYQREADEREGISGPEEGGGGGEIDKETAAGRRMLAQLDLAAEAFQLADAMLCKSLDDEP